MTKQNIDKHYFSTKSDIDALERDILNRRYVERYMVARQFVHGVVMDVACGCGYGSYILAKNPDVTKVYGIDESEEAIQFAEREYASERIHFSCRGLADIQLGPINTLISLETIEHLEDPRSLNKLAQDHEAETLIISFPNKKTTHYNLHHRWDLKTQDIEDIFFEYNIYKEFIFAYDTCFLCLVRQRHTGSREKRWR